ncbi:uncharacterized protein BDZ99DRAFT_517608 [Mytilinidion resinicola]|uniref:Gem-associated protein 5 TPR domain-containing protein n=1 Tax=Mytilinidion resinicola TaxID=574789 RepID=A0A6A6YXW4_9PEZI|nr:uncharacterized protein BDZ99DRAFT_517608 [Mytilinidion resinicola]KAF2813339.1 hypothetical protein BDZ99DRAFT_517608 [Mytilinidion resinicola]
MKPPTPSITPGNDEFGFEPCAATASFLLYAQRNVILCLHHDTLAIERRFTRHREDVTWISVDNVSERGAGRLVVSYDAGSTAIVWDLFTGEEVARFASYEQIRVAAWMRNGNVAFGNAQGNVILFEPSTSEHISSRTIFDPITALAPAADCRTFAIGYLNGSILITTLQPTFTILHTLTTPRAPSPLVGLAWHGSSSKQKSEMLATQTSDGDLRVWSVPKAPHGDAPCVIRILNKSESYREPGPCWFGWSKNGRIVQYSEGQTCSWDVRTKRVSYEPVPTIDGIVAIANYGPTATLFTLGRNHTVQQYDINPNGTAVMVADKQHPPANTPPSPPVSLEERRRKGVNETPVTAHPAGKLMVPMLPVYIESESSEGEGVAMSPLQKIAQEMDQLEEERRDRVGPLSPVSSRGSQSSRSSGGSRGGGPKYRYDKPSTASTRSSKASMSSAGTGTIFSSGSSSVPMSSGDSISIRSYSTTSSKPSYKSSSLRNQIMHSPDDVKKPKFFDLFPYTKARLSDVSFKTPQYGQQRTPDDLRQQMLSVVFGWDDDIETLIRDELARHAPGTPASVLLSKWLGDLGADMMASMVGSQSMTSSDWMLLALSSMGQDSQKKVGETFVQRLLEKGDIHPAVAILLGLGEPNEAIEVYVSRKYFMEAILLTCLLLPNDWQRQSFLVRKWGEVAVSHGKPELAVRCFSCTSLESSEPWFSPRAQDAVFSAQKQVLLGSQLSPPLSPPGGQVPSRITAKLSALKLVTNFGEKPSPQMLSTTDEQTPMNVGVTPIAESALSPAGATNQWLRPSTRGLREPSSARTATPGAYRRKRLPSKSDADRSERQERGPTSNLAALVIPDRMPERSARVDTAIPQTAVDTTGREGQTIPFSHRRASSSSAPQDFTLSATTYDPRNSSSSNAKQASVPAPSDGVFATLRQQSRSRNGSRARKPDGLHLEVHETIDSVSHSALSGTELSPPLTGASVKSAKARSIDQYISSLEEANFYARQHAGGSRNENRTPKPPPEVIRPESRNARARSRPRDLSESRGRSGVRYIRPAKRSPSSPVPMSPEDAGIYPRSKKEASTNTENFDDERYYRVSSPIESIAESVASSRPRHRSRSRAATKARSSSKAPRRVESPDRVKAGSRATSRATSRRPAEDRGRSNTRGDAPIARSPSSPLPMNSQALFYRDDDDGRDDEPVRPRQRSTSRRPQERGTSARRDASPDRRMAASRRGTPAPSLRGQSRSRQNLREPSPDRSERPESYHSNNSSVRSGNTGREQLAPQPSHLRMMSRKELAARELEERRLSLARRPSAPIIPHPGDLAHRPIFSERSQTDLGNSPSYLSSQADPIMRSQTADPEVQKRYSPKQMALPPYAIGLPATPRAMRHPKYMHGDPNNGEVIPAVPTIPDNLGMLQSSEELQADDSLGPLLPATVYGQKISQPPRSASAPPEKFQGNFQKTAPVQQQPPPVRRGSLNNRGHSRMNTPPEVGVNYKRVSPPPFRASIDETLHENQIVIIEQDPNAPPMLAELQHLAGPPPPPPPPLAFGHSPKSSLGVINIAIDEKPTGTSQTTSPLLETSPPVTTSPLTHRRGRGSVSENIGAKFRSVTERMRSTSRNRVRSPQSDQAHNPSPYESIPPPIPFPRNARSPTEHTVSQYGAIPPPPPPPAPGSGGQMMEQVIPPDDASMSRRETQSQFYRNPKEIRANMPPEQLQQGVYQPEAGMI